MVLSPKEIKGFYAHVSSNPGNSAPSLRMPLSQPWKELKHNMVSDYCSKEISEISVVGLGPYPASSRSFRSSQGNRGKNQLLGMEWPRKHEAGIDKSKLWPFTTSTILVLAVTIMVVIIICFWKMGSFTLQRQKLMLILFSRTLVIGRNWPGANHFASLNLSKAPHSSNYRFFSIFVVWGANKYEIFEDRPRNTKLLE